MTRLAHLSPTLLGIRIRNYVARGVVVAAVAAGSLAVGAPIASAQQSELPVNALAPEITSAADLAIEAYDEYIASGGEESGTLDSYLLYAERRTATARLAARQLGYDEFAMIEAWMAATLQHQRAVLAAMSQIGVPYRSLASKEDVGFDCSGLTLFAWSAAGVQLQRVSGAQIRSAADIDFDDAMAGDLIYYPGHIMMYLGVDNAIVHSISTGRTVEIDTISARRVGRVQVGDPLA